MNLTEMPTQINDQEEPLSLPGMQEENLSENTDSLYTMHATDEATANPSGNGPGLRVLRVSPLMLAFCGTVFISLIFVMDFLALKSHRAATVSRTSSVRQAEAVTLPQSSERDQKATTNAPAVVAVAPAAQQSASVPAVAQSSPAQSPSPAAQSAAQEQPAPGPLTNDESKPAQASAPPPADSAHEGGFTLQVGSFNSAAEADERVGKLSALGVRAYTVRVEIPKRGTWYRVQAGRFMNREEAGRYGAQLRGKGVIADFIVTQ